MRSVIIFIATTLVASSAAAQVAPAPSIGAHVRIAFDCRAAATCRHVEGTLAAVEPGVLRVSSADHGVLADVSRDSIARFEVGTWKSNTGRGAGIGALIGIGLGVALGAGACAGGSGWFEPTPGECAAAFGVTLGVLGTVIGAVAGSKSHHFTWSDAPLPDLARVMHVRPASAGGVIVGVSVRF